MYNPVTINIMHSTRLAATSFTRFLIHFKHFINCSIAEHMFKRFRRVIFHISPGFYWFFLTILKSEKHLITVVTGKKTRRYFDAKILFIEKLYTVEYVYCWSLAHQTHLISFTTVWWFSAFRLINDVDNLKMWFQNV